MLFVQFLNVWMVHARVLIFGRLGLYDQLDMEYVCDIFVKVVFAR